MRRTHHKKSRMGCMECKRRHIKCDESRPVCVNCLVTQRTCTYTRPAAPSEAVGELQTYPATTPETTVQVSTTLATPLTPPSPAVVPSTQLEESAGLAQSAVNIQHMQLMSHFFLETCGDLSFGEQLVSPTYRYVMQRITSTPYLIHQALAFAALHMSSLNMSESAAFSEQAARFQTEALTAFNGSKAATGPETDASTFIFANLLGYYYLADAVQKSRVEESGHFLNQFIVYLNVHRGVRAVLGSVWTSIQESGLSHVLDKFQNDIIPQTKVDREPGQEIRDLHRMFEISDLGPTAMTSCQEALEHLKWIFSIEQVAGERHCGLGGAITAWAVLLPPDFCHQLSKRTPEALIILAHYAILLYRRRHIWVFKNAGQMLIESITAYLGSYWGQWLMWPNNMILSNIPNSFF